MTGSKLNNGTSLAICLARIILPKNMRLALYLVIVAFLSGCATTHDPINRLVANLSASQGQWQKGDSPQLDLPEDATPEQVIKKVFLMTSFDQGHVKNCIILKMQRVHIENSLAEFFTAALVQTDFGEKIVVFQYLPVVGWWSRVFEVNTNG